jgi:hypothetical protein
VGTSRYDIEIDNSLSIHNERDARYAPGHSIPVDKEADTLSRASDDS